MLQTYISRRIRYSVFVVHRISSIDGSAASVGIMIIEISKNLVVNWNFFLFSNIRTTIWVHNNCTALAANYLDR